MFKKYIAYAGGISLGGAATSLILSLLPEEQLQAKQKPFLRYLTEMEGEGHNLNATEPHSPEGHEDAHSHGHEISPGGMMIFFIFICLFAGAIFKEIKKKTNIPYTPMVLIFGLVIGYYDTQLGFFGEAVSLVNKIDPHTLLMIFIPGLIFEGAYNTDGYVFNKSKWQVLIMAGPGVLITSFILAYSFVYLFGYEAHLTVSEALGTWRFYKI